MLAFSCEMWCFDLAWLRQLLVEKSVLLRGDSAILPQR